MISAQDYEKKVWATVDTIAKKRQIHLEWKTAAEAKLHKTRITQVQKELRIIKKDIGLTKKAINAAYASEKAKVGKGVGASINAGIFGKKTMGKANTVAKDNIRQHQLNTIAPYEDVNRLIDSLLVQLDQFKLQLDSWLAANS